MTHTAIDIACNRTILYKSDPFVSPIGILERSAEEHAPQMYLCHRLGLLFHSKPPCSRKGDYSIVPHSLKLYKRC